jgi:hypothetical protein
MSKNRYILRFDGRCQNNFVKDVPLYMSTTNACICSCHQSKLMMYIIKCSILDNVKKCTLNLLFYYYTIEVFHICKMSFYFLFYELSFIVIFDSVPNSGIVPSQGAQETSFCRKLYWKQFFLISLKLQALSAWDSYCPFLPWTWPMRIIL